MLKRWVQVVRLYLARVLTECSMDGTGVGKDDSKEETQGQENNKNKIFTHTESTELAATTITEGVDATRTSVSRACSAEGTSVANGDSEAEPEIGLTRTDASESTTAQYSTQKRGACTVPEDAETNCKRHCHFISC